uniref:V-type proton ATPase subunit a n=1 Tax=Haemonchus contortus TaxID=6289 RepID=A0A7I4YMT2_HAECO
MCLAGPGHIMTSQALALALVQYGANLELTASHRQQRKELVIFTELFVLSHEWYEILVTAKLGLGEEESMESTEPGDRIYPKPVKTYRSYYKEDVTRMVKHKLIKFDALLEGEQEACEFAKAENRSNTTLEHEALRQMRESFGDLQDEIRRQNESNTEWTETVRFLLLGFGTEQKKCGEF